MVIDRRLFVTAGLSLAAAGAAPLPLMPGWQEAVLIVPDTAPWIETLTNVGGWEVAARTAPDAALNGFWKLPAGAATEQVLLRNIGTTKGYIRLVRVMGAPQSQIRPDDQAWETGGVSALDIRVVDIVATRAALHARGWRGPSDPVEYKAYGFDVIQWAPESPDGSRISFIQRIAPKLVGWGELKKWSRAANAAVVTRDMAGAQAFFAGRLGMAQVSHTNSIGSDGPNVMGLPWGMARDLAVDIRGFAAGATGGSAVELISIPAAQGRDFAAAAHPPNWGIAALRVLTGDARLAASRLGATVMALNIPPYGSCIGFCLTSPDGVRLEFYQPQA